MNNKKAYAIWLTAIGLEYGRSYSYSDIDVYRLQGVGGTDYIISIDSDKKIFSDADEAAEIFATNVWKRNAK